MRGLLLLYKGGIFIKKEFLTYDQQLEKLQKEKALTISDNTYARDTLMHIGYYSLITGYKQLFLHPSSGKYLYGVTFEELTCFYYFDEELRTLFLKYILHIERHLKSIISYHFCKKYGIEQSHYLHPDNFNTSKKHQKSVYRLIHSLNACISLPTHYKYIRHYATKYSNVPLWVAMNAVTFGQLSAFYQYMPNEIQAKVSKHFYGYSEKQLHQFITVIAKCRNVCAHGERLYDFHTTDAIPDTLLHKKLKIATKNGSYISGKNDLFAIVISLRYLMTNNEFRKFKSSLLSLIRQTLRKCPHITETQLLTSMGFPLNWKNICRYKYY